MKISSTAFADVDEGLGAPDAMLAYEESSGCVEARRLDPDWAAEAAEAGLYRTDEEDIERAAELDGMERLGALGEAA